MTNTMQLNLLVLHTARLEAVRSFYETLGFHLVEEKHGNGPVHYSWITSNFVIEFYPRNGRPEPRCAAREMEFTFTVKNIEPIFAAISNLSEPPEWTFTASKRRTIRVRDPDGRLIKFVEVIAS